jgi:hypothetical protein
LLGQTMDPVLRSKAENDAAALLLCAPEVLSVSGWWVSQRNG